MVADPAMSLTQMAGEWFGPFQLINVLGVGAMGAVYLAKDSVLQRDVAIKLIAKGGADTDPDRRDRFLREARAAAKLIHPNVVQIFQVGEDPAFRYIAMEYVEGMTTASAAKLHGGRLPDLFAIEKMREAADALQLAASLGICHRDIKPANLLLTGSGALKIADFGLASHAGGPDSGPAAGSLEGTPFYMSPEQWAGGATNPASDLYSLGCTFYHLLVGKTPYAARELAGCYQAHCYSPIPDPKQLVPDMDPLLAELLRQCMAKRAEERPTAGEILTALDDMLMLRRSTVRSRATMPGAGVASKSPVTPDAASTSSVAYQPTMVPGTISSISRLSSLTGRASYQAFFGLRGYPFSDIRQPASFWDAGPHAWALRTLVAQIVAGQRPAMLLGEGGSGRTFVCEMMRNKFPNVLTFSVEPQLLFGSRPMVTLCRQVGATTVSPGASQQVLIGAFLSQVLFKAPADAVATVVIDGVDPSDRELLFELNDILRSAPVGKFSMILVGSEQLPGALAANGAPYSLYSGAQPLALPGLTQREMVDYIDFRMNVIGGRENGLNLDLGIQQLLHARSGGSPKLINIFCHNVLTIAALKQESTIRMSTLLVAMKSKTYLTAEAALAMLAG